MVRTAYAYLIEGSALLMKNPCIDTFFELWHGYGEMVKIILYKHNKNKVRLMF